ncbi:hypothetical protein AtubIFM55763_002164 [Aspergillus tubingensis]|uniref:Uncharacterized protein n=1 Tax=Aspergillus tubingensis TaxID=5068 RepID=A0A9W6EPI2_ASPTU|nr:hypothetical protein AtubIFM54640_005464 [Aspergillus tubingensis]GLA71684.1 hypothetical protein AtubIFM55763_002164 [Aspergillus tubingensis]GLA87029.1 hypothetical protein AtubIFM56815_011300 [Aspergillus tubingensis]GLA97991.1 hypothetical protein AtubIFM57143_005924 [Aspergillus tubingensis]
MRADFDSNGSTVHSDSVILGSKNPGSVIIGSTSTQSPWSGRKETSAETFMEIYHPTLGYLGTLVNTFCNTEVGGIPAKVIVRTGSITGIYARLMDIKKGIESA